MINNPFSLKNKVILITGASSGIGRQCAITCSHLGASVIIMGRDKERLQETLSAMDTSKNHKVISVDLSEPEKVKNYVEEAKDKLGRINGLINCAGISTTLPFKNISIDKMEEFFSTNVISGLNLTKHVINHSNFSSEGGSVIFLSSVMGVAGAKGKVLYSMTKGALLSVTRSLALELALRKIRVNSISPGVVQSPMSESAVYSQNKDALDEVRSEHPLGLGITEDIANACAFLLSDGARWITGTNLVVDGGYLAK